MKDNNSEDLILIFKIGFDKDGIIMKVNFLLFVFSKILMKFAVLFELAFMIVFNLNGFLKYSDV